MKTHGLFDLVHVAESTKEWLEVVRCNGYDAIAHATVCVTYIN
jgi:hypothetical protein